MDEQMVIRCPNCGSWAQRCWSDRLPMGSRCPAHQVTQTECPVCDYFMVMCGQNGAVLEAYAPGIQGRSTPTTTPRAETAIALMPVSSTLALAPRKLLTGQY